MGDDRGQLHRRRRDQPDPLPGVEVLLGERPGAGPDPVGHQLVVDLLAGLHDLGDRPAGDERQRVLADGVDVVGAALVAGDAELGLLPDEPGHVAGGEVLAGGQAAGEPEERGAHHHRVVDVEERRAGRVGVRRPAGGGDVGGGGGGGAGDVRAGLLVGQGLGARGPAAAQRHVAARGPPSDRSAHWADDSDPSGAVGRLRPCGQQSPRSPGAEAQRTHGTLGQRTPCAGELGEAARGGCDARRRAASAGRELGSPGSWQPAGPGDRRHVPGTGSRAGPPVPGSTGAAGRARRAAAPRRWSEPAAGRRRRAGHRCPGLVARGRRGLAAHGTQRRAPGREHRPPRRPGPPAQSGPSASPSVRVATSASRPGSCGDRRPAPRRAARGASAASPSDWPPTQTPGRRAARRPGASRRARSPGGALGGLVVHRPGSRARARVGPGSEHGALPESVTGGRQRVGPSSAMPPARRAGCWRSRAGSGRGRRRPGPAGSARCRA